MFLDWIDQTTRFIKAAYGILEDISMPIAHLIVNMYKYVPVYPYSLPAGNLLSKTGDICQPYVRTSSRSTYVSCMDGFGNRHGFGQDTESDHGTELKLHLVSKSSSEGLGLDKREGFFWLRPMCNDVRIHFHGFERFL